MNENTEVIRFEIDGRWTVSEMSQSLAHLEDLYNIRLLLGVMRDESMDWEKFYFELMHFPPFRKSMKRRFMNPYFFAAPFLQNLTIPLESAQLSRTSRLVFPNEQFEVRQIEYGSPGFKDLAGIGEVVGHIKDFAIVLIDRWLGRKESDLNNDERQLRNDGMRIENARKFVQLAKEIGYNEQEVRELVRLVDDRQETLIHLIESGKITDVYLLSEKQKPRG